MRSIPPARIRLGGVPGSKSANLMLDEPPLIVRICLLTAGMIASPHFAIEAMIH
jgi:hypothetical protein